MSTMLDTRHLALSWSTSRGRDTYGWTICRLDDSATGKRYRCNGGGYDMVGTVVAAWLQDVYQEKLQAIGSRAYTRYGIPGKCEHYSYDRNESGLYGMTLHTDGRVSLDGACGIESILRIARAAGIVLARLHSRKGDTTGYLATELHSPEED